MHEKRSGFVDPMRPSRALTPFHGGLLEGAAPHDVRGGSPTDEATQVAERTDEPMMGNVTGDRLRSTRAGCPEAGVQRTVTTYDSGKNAAWTYSGET